MKRIIVTGILILCLTGYAPAQLKAGGVDMDAMLQKLIAVEWIDSANKYINHKLIAAYTQCFYPVNDSIETELYRKCCSCPALSERDKDSVRNKLNRQFLAMQSCNDKALTSAERYTDSLRKVIIVWVINKIKPIAQANGYDLVFDLCKESTLPLPPCYDITDLILKKLEW
ncbi:MAG: OmpH family outer membrane protein [Bacteroidetes bacterium]|nr:OmpH family outer membrane protein [Bacteroidota bacterium]